MAPPEGRLGSGSSDTYDIETIRIVPIMLMMTAINLVTDIFVSQPGFKHPEKKPQLIWACLTPAMDSRAWM